MVNIEELLSPDETILKKQSGVVFGLGMGPTGDLFLTNKRLLFLHKKRYALISPPALTGNDLIIELQNVRSVRKGSFGSIKIQADKEYTFAVTIFQNGDWVDAVNTAMNTLPRFQQQPSPPFQTSQQQQTPPLPPPPPQHSSPLCPSCGRATTFIQQYNRWYCHFCQRYI